MSLAPDIDKVRSWNFIKIVLSLAMNLCRKFKKNQFAHKCFKNQLHDLIQMNIQKSKQITNKKINKEKKEKTVKINIILFSIGILRRGVMGAISTPRPLQFQIFSLISIEKYINNAKILSTLPASLSLEKKSNRNAKSQFWENWI